MARGNPLRPGDFLPPMLAMTADAPFSRAGWWYETKWDGYRAIISVGRQFRIYSRRGHDLLAWYPSLAEARHHLPGGMVFDAELVAWQDGRPVFSALQQRAADHYLLMVFDCLYAEGRWLTQEPLKRRLELLHHHVSTNGLVVVSDGIEARGEAYFRAISDMGLEGVMAKRLDSVYVPGRRSPLWQKFLALQTGWFWVVAVQQAADGTWYWHLGDRRASRVVSVGKVRAPSGWRGPSDSDPLTDPFRVEVEYREMTREGHLRHARIRQWQPVNVAQYPPSGPPPLS